MTTTSQEREVYCYLGDDTTNAHGIILSISDEDARFWYAVREQFEGRLPAYAYGHKVIVTNLKDGGRYVLRTAPCGTGCRCAAQAYPLDEAGRLFVGDDCTLDGKPATISGRTLDFGWVSQLPHGTRAEFAWPTIARIMDNGGRFSS